MSGGMPWGMLTAPRSSPQDDDAHMDFIMAASNLRAENYGIPPADWLTVRGCPGGPHPHGAPGDTPLLSSEQAHRRAHRARHCHHHGSRGRPGVPGGLQAGVEVPGPQLLPHQHPVPVRVPPAPCRARAAPHLLGRTLSPGVPGSPPASPVAAAAAGSCLTKSSCGSRRAAGTGPGAAGGAGPGSPPAAGGGKAGQGRGQAQIGTVWAIEAPLSGGLWRARQPFLRGRKRRLEPDWPGGPRAGGRKRGREAPPTPPRRLQLGFGLPSRDVASPRLRPAICGCPAPCHSLGVSWPCLAPSLRGGCRSVPSGPDTPTSTAGTSVSQSQDTRRDSSCSAVAGAHGLRLGGWQCHPY